MPLAELLGEVYQKLAVFDALAPVLGYRIVSQVGTADGPGYGRYRIRIASRIGTAFDCRSIVFRKPEHAGKRARQRLVGTPAAAQNVADIT